MSDMPGCCESMALSNPNLAEVLAKADMNAFNKDVVNILYCIKAIELMTGKDAADNLRKQIVHFVENDEVPIHW